MMTGGAWLHAPSSHSTARQRRETTAAVIRSSHARRRPTEPRSAAKSLAAASCPPGVNELPAIRWTACASRCENRPKWSS